MTIIEYLIQDYYHLTNYLFVYFYNFVILRLHFTVIRLLLYLIMRRTPYTDRFERTFIKGGSLYKPQPQIDLNSNSFKLELNKIAEDNPVTAKNKHVYYQPRPVRSSLNRPFTTNRANSFVEIRSTSRPYVGQLHDSHLNLNRKELHVGQFKDNSFTKQREQLDITKGRLYRGSSWKVDEKIYKQPLVGTGGVGPTRYQSYKKQQDITTQAKDSGRKSRRSSGVMDLVGKNLRKSETPVVKQQEFFQYVMRFSFRTKKGYIPSNSSKQNQDAYIISPNINGKTWQHLFSVCDGHGPLGHLVSNFVKNSLPQCVSQSKGIDKNPKESLLKAYELAYSKLLKQSNVDMSFSGSTVISCFLQQNKLYCANVGDSRAILGRNLKNNSWQAIALSTDHKPSLEKEAERIKKMKGRVQAYKDEYGESIGPLRVWVQHENVPGLAMTRSFGDLVGASVGVSHIPQITEFSLTQEDKIIVIGSDGVFQFLQNQEIIRSLVPYYQNKQIQQASDNLLNMANRSWTKNSSIIDDITFILIFINYNEI